MLDQAVDHPGFKYGSATVKYFYLPGNPGDSIFGIGGFRFLMYCSQEVWFLTSKFKVERFLL
jgi:hypothetical protein